MNAPPAALAGTYVVAYAEVDDSVTFIQRHTLAVDGESLGRVPGVAICQDFKSSEFLVQYCDASWDTVAIAAGYQTLEEAKRRTEYSYAGISRRWQDSAASKAQALVEHQSSLAQEICSFCGRTPLDADCMFGSEVKICNNCIESFHRSLHSADA